MFVKKLLGVCTATVMFFSATISVNAVNANANLPEEIQEFADVVGLDGLDSPRPLYSPDEELFGYCAEGDNCYIIYDTEYNMVEYSDSKLSEYHNVTTTLYYGGPLAYYVKESEVFEDLQSGKLYTVDDFCFSDELKSQVEANEIAIDSELDSEIQPMATVTANYTIPDADFSYYDPAWNTESKYPSSCGQVAATAVLAYLQAVEGIDLPTFYLQTPYYLFLELIQTIPHNDESYATSVLGMVTGLNNYATKKGCSYYVTSAAFSTSAENTYRTKARDEIPSLISITGHPKYGDHWVIGYGYKTVQLTSGTSKSVIVDDGWGNDNICISDI
ncbi:MAG: hypothetical protein LUH08_01675, partial [Ruminococcus sp.]|nr:hypothetical protein [Ruminococcus sp.]